MKTHGTVLKLEGEFAIVGVKRHTACDTCRAQCGGHCDKADTVETKVKNTLQAKIGDEVELFSKTSAIMWASVLVFVLPIVMAIAGYAIPLMLGVSQALSALSAPFMFLFTFFIIWKVWGKKDRFTEIEMTRIIENDRS